MQKIDILGLTRRLIACPSVTPLDAGAMAVIAEALQSIGFTVHRFASGEVPDGPVENLFAIRGEGGSHFAFAGHSDVVPAGEGWQTDPFVPEVRGELLYGRGAVDMKGAIAAFIAAAERITDQPGTLSLIITGDEEGAATFGTVKLIEWMNERGIRPDFCLVGEPTSANRLGDMVKIGRRGSVNIWIENGGSQGHVAYPHLADNPIPPLVKALNALDALHLDDGNRWFQPSNLEITTIDVANAATNVIPSVARARINIRFNDEHKGAELVELVRASVSEHAPKAMIRAVISGESFITPPGDFSSLVADAITEVTGLVPELSTTGGTSDARFLSRICPVVEFGLCNATMHKLDEAVAIPDLHALSDIYERIARAALSR